MNTNSLTAQLKEHALSHGVDLIGITSADPFIKRDGSKGIIDPQRFLVGARSVIVTAFYLYDGFAAPPMDQDHPRGRLAHAKSIRAYTPMMDHYTALIQGFLGRHGYQTVPAPDDGFSAKMAAARAGVGKYGKNSVIITREYGSQVELVVLITTAPLQTEEYDIGASDCGSCDVCIKACPTGALYALYKLNKPLCICEWLWGTFAPIHLREKQENRLFGCGDCVDVCPRNLKLAPRDEFPVQVEDVSTAPELIPLLTGSEEYYRKTVPSFAMRAGMDAIRGNVIIALGNIGAAQAVDPLCKTLAHPKPQIRAYSAWALGKIGGAQAAKALENALQSEANPEVKTEMRSALGK